MKTTEQKIDAVLAMTKELRSIKEELAALHEHEAILNERAEQCMAAITGNPLSPGRAPIEKERKTTLGEMVTLSLLMRAPRPMSAIEIATDLNLHSQITSIRGTLSRLASDGKIQKVGYGKYTMEDATAA